MIYDRSNIRITSNNAILPHIKGDPEECKSEFLCHLTHQILKVITKESIPAIYHPLGNSLSIKDLKRHHTEVFILFYSKLNSPLCVRYSSV